MNLRYFALTPQDAWFFRDGRPYNHTESNQADVESVFPPPARTLTGAVRAALARANGWSGSGRWTSELNRTLGAGPDDLGGLQFTAPFLLRNGEPLWPLPRHLLGLPVDGVWTPATLLRPDPGAGLTLTDQGAICLPETPLPPESRDGLKAAEAAWITTAGLAEILPGRLPQPETVCHPGKLWKSEARVGLRRDSTTLNVGEGDLYSPGYVCFCRHVALGVGVAGVPADMRSLPSLFPLGGESRLAQAESWPRDPLPMSPPADSFAAGTDNFTRFAVVLLTSGRFEDPAPLLSPETKTVSACVGKPQFIGGWDSLKNAPLPLEPFHPAGSVWFCETPAPELRNILAWHGKWLGEAKHTRHGFGQIVIGLWPTAHA